MATQKEKEKNPSLVRFEDALEELEQIVQNLEQEQLPLEELMENYAKGKKLLTACQGMLESAKEKLQVIQQGSGNEEKGASAETKEQANNFEDDDVRLF